MVVIILQYIHISNHNVVYFKVTQCYVSLTSQWRHNLFFKFQERKQTSALDSDMTKYLELPDRELKLSVIHLLRAQWKSEQCAETDERRKLDESIKMKCQK